MEHKSSDGLRTAYAKSLFALIISAALLPLTANAQGAPDIVWMASAHADGVLSVAFSPGGALLASGSKYPLLRRGENLKRDQRARLEEVLSLNERLNTMYYLKDLLPYIWSYRSRGWAENTIAQWCELARADGHPATVAIVQSSGFAPLDDSALSTVRDHWRFVPARRDGEPVESRVTVPIRFRLEDVRG